MVSQYLLVVTCSSSLFILLLFHQTSLAKTHDCRTSSCGIISNISSPFRLQDDPKHCGNPRFELACEENVTFFYLHSQKYQVKAINYNNSTIWLADVSVTNNTCSFPNHSLYADDISNGYDSITFEPRLHLYIDRAWPINFMSCPYPLKNSSLFTEVTHCNSSHSPDRRFSYVKIGHMNASEVQHMCSLDIIVLTSWKFRDLNNVSLLEIHDSLLYGFKLNFYVPTGGSATVALIIFSVSMWLLIGAIIVLPVPAGSFAAVIVLAFYAYLSIRGYYRVEDLPLAQLVFLIGLVLGAKNFLFCPCMMGILIYKFRRRHCSMFDAIEEYLQSDNKLMPIRYSYSDIKRITRGFQDKLGQGGYGSVYKGKLRSGHYVAVKLLKNLSSNGQDFMNEIATIGRIHHVNVIKLVGYCAERSKRALVYDFMPNGSLEKYIFKRDEAHSLNWKTKFEIAVGVARGIEYLHKGCDIQILHFDIKPHNILLDDNFIPKVADFGLAKFFSTEKKTLTLTAARGTIGYVAPELITRGIGNVSFKADVYSFGMLLIEMVGLKKDLIGNNEKSSQYFPYWIYDCLDKGRGIGTGITDENNMDDDDNDSSHKIAKKMAIVALWCIQMSPDDRSSMNKVLEMLEGEVERLQIPHRSSHSPQPQIADQSGSTYSTDSVSLLHHDAALSLEIIVEDQ